MKEYKVNAYKIDFDYEEDDYDRLKNMKKKESFTNKSKMKRFEFDYEEDYYEPIARRD
ncbi:hypothetical protein [Marinisporobacter balticus]|uniref:Uncharacterized protein n=1 Tax=Marinisporobacter balticus TaxID=2018667 RepID=A0A4R2KEL2_9FIRM|nr:hypothetical protein [Marinisporobacter balticus]TCO68739.1 hypothetical protein EV214_14118 [Marinisporobacter balticus]